MPVVDKHKPVRAEFGSFAPIASTGAGLALTLLLLASFSTQTLVNWAWRQESLPRPVVSAIEGWHGGARAVGLVGARAALESVFSFVDSTAVLFSAPVPVAPDVEGAPTPSLPPKLTTTPAERWADSPLRQRPERILIVGASSIQGALGVGLEEELNARYEGIVVKRKGKAATGLTRDDVYDWVAETHRLMDEFKPDVVVAQFGGNDAQNIISPTLGPQTVGSEGWKLEYHRRVKEYTAGILERGALPILVGMPVMRSPKFNRRMVMTNEITRSAAEEAGGRFAGVFDFAADDQGEYKVEVSHEGRRGRMRQDDGIHFTRLGGNHVASRLARRLEQHVVLVPRGPERAAGDDDDSAEPATPTPDLRPAVAYPMTIDSPVRGPSPALAYVPHDVPEQGLPIWYLLHGAWGSFADWPDHAHDALQELAREHRMIVVVPDGLEHGWYLDSPLKPEHRLGTWLVDLTLSAEKQLPGNGVRAIAGNSMGGHGAFSAVMARPDAFVSVSSISGALDLEGAKTRKGLIELLGAYEDNQHAWDARSVLDRFVADPTSLPRLPLLLSCGTEDRWFRINQAMHEELLAAGVQHDWRTSKEGHTWGFWAEELPVHAAFAAQHLYAAVGGDTAP